MCDTETNRNSRSGLPFDSLVMEVYYRLSSGDSSVREEASLSLVNDLRLAQSLFDDNNSSSGNIPKVIHGNGSANGNGFGDPRIPHIRVAEQISPSAHVSEDEDDDEDDDHGGTAQDKEKEKENEEEEELQNCAPSVRYALRRLVRGVGSSREVYSIFAFCFLFDAFSVCMVIDFGGKNLYIHVRGCPHA